MSMRTGTSAFLAVVLSVVLTGCGADGEAQPSAVGQSLSPATAAPAASEAAASGEPEAAPVNPVEVLARIPSVRMRRVAAAEAYSPFPVPTYRRRSTPWLPSTPSRPARH